MNFFFIDDLYDVLRSQFATALRLLVSFSRFEGFQITDLKTDPHQNFPRNTLCYFYENEKLYVY